MFTTLQDRQAMVTVLLAGNKRREAAEILSSNDPIFIDWAIKTCQKIIMTPEWKRLVKNEQLTKATGK